MSGFLSRVRLAAYVVLLLVLFVPAFTLTSLRLLEPGSGRGVVAVSLTPLALPVYAVLAVVGLLGLFGRRRAARTVPAAVALLVALVGVASHAYWLWPSFTGDRPAAAAGARPFGVLSVNLHLGQGDPAAVVAAATRNDVRIVVLVEVTPTELQALDDRGLARSFPYRAGEAVPSGGGTVILSSSRVSDTVALDTAYGSWATTVALPTAYGGRLRVWGVHPRRPQETGNGWSRDLAALGRDLRTGNPPDIVAGDFNSTLDHARFRDLLDAGLRDSAEMDNTGWMPTWAANGFFHGLPRFVQIDHVLVDPALTALSVHRVDVPDTDHSGVLARLAYR